MHAAFLLSVCALLSKDNHNKPFHLTAAESLYLRAQEATVLWPKHVHLHIKWTLLIHTEELIFLVTTSILLTTQYPCCKKDLPSANLFSETEISLILG
jgi:hypothetical protein